MYFIVTNYLLFTCIFLCIILWASLLARTHIVNTDSKSYGYERIGEEVQSYHFQRNLEQKQIQVIVVGHGVCWSWSTTIL